MPTDNLNNPLFWEGLKIPTKAPGPSPVKPVLEQAGKAVEATADAARGAASYVKGVASSVWQGTPPGAIQHTAQTGEVQPELQQAVHGLSALHPPVHGSEYTAEQAFEQGGVGKVAAAGAVALGEFAGFGKAAHAMQFIASPIVEGMSGMLKSAIVNSGLAARMGMETMPVGAELASQLAGSTTEQIVATGVKAAGRKVVADKAKSVTSAAIVGGALGAGQAAASKALGMQPQWSANIVLGALIGAGAGVFGQDTAAKLQQQAPKLMQTLSAGDKEALGHIHEIATSMESKGIPHTVAMKHISDVMNNTASESSRIFVNGEIAAKPHMLKNPAIAELFQRSRKFTSPEIVIDNKLADDSPIKVQYEDSKRTLHDTTVTRTQLDRLDALASHGKIYMQRVEGPAHIADRYSGVKQRNQALTGFTLPDEGKVNSLLSSLEQGDFVDGVFGGRRGIIPRFPQTTPEPLRDPKFTAGAGSGSAANSATPTSAVEPFNFSDFGTPIPQEMVGDVQPVVRAGKSTKAGKPIAVPGAEAIIPADSSTRTAVPNVPELKQPMRLTDSQKKAFDAIKSGKGVEKLNPATVSSLVTKKVIRPEDIHHAETAQSIAASLFDRISETKDTVKKAQLQEHALALRDQALRLRGEYVEPKTLMNREGETGDIVRVIKHDNTTDAVVDKRGKVAVVRKNTVKPNKVISLNDIEPITKRSTNGQKAESLKKLESAIGANDKKPVNIKGNKIARGLKGYSKGAITFTKSAVEKSYLGDIVRKSGLELYRAQNGGYIVRQGEMNVNLPNPDAVLDFMTRYTTAARVEAEQEHVLESGKAALPNVEGVARFSPLVDTYHKLSMALNTPGDTSAVPYVHFSGIGADGWRMQKTELAGMGEAGRKLATAADHFSGLWETLSSQDRQLSVNAAHDLKRRGITGDMIENGTASPEDVALYKKYIGTIWDRNYNDAKGFGIEGDYIQPAPNGAHVPHHFDFTPKDVPFDTIAELKSMKVIGETATAQDAANVLNDPERFTMTNKAMTDPKSKAVMLENLRKIRAKQAYLAGTLEKNRRGNAGWITDIPTLVDRGINSQSRRLAEAAVFGPNLEHHDQYLSEIAHLPAVGNEMHERAFQIMMDVRGKHFIPTSGVGTSLMDLGRGMLGASATRHLWQSGLLAMRMPLKTMHGVFDFMAHLGKNEEHAQWVGSAMDRGRWELTEGDRLSATAIEPNIITRFSKAYGTAGSALLHQTIGTIRKVGTYAGEHAFDSYYDKALAGDRSAMALLNEGLKQKLTPQQLGSMDKVQLRRIFAKSVADFAGFTFRPQDMPRIARNPLGKAMIQFRSFQWQSAANWFNALTDKQLPKSTRAARALRLFVLIPSIGMLDPIIRHRIGRDTIDSEEARQSFDRMWGNPTTRNVIATEVEAMINQHMLGFASDLLQGGLTGSQQITEKAVTSAINPASTVIPLALYHAATAAANGYMTGDENYGKEARKTLANLGGRGGSIEELGALAAYGIAGPTGAAAAQAIGLYRQGPREKPVALPKHNLLVGR